MQIVVKELGKRFERQWVFRRLNFLISSGSRHAVVGANGSGKSTLMKILAGWLYPTEGSVLYLIDDKPLADHNELYSHLTLAAPYLELIEEFTLAEMIDFHFRFKKPLPGLTLSDIIQESGLKDKAQRQIRHFSSGMKQRVKLVLSLLSDTTLVLLDEPCTNLDEEATRWYRRLIFQYTLGRTVVVFSNHASEEFDFCDEVALLDVLD